MNTDTSIESSSQPLRIALGIGVLYLTMGVAWILLSDSLVAATSTDSDWLVLAQRYKGLFYVLVTAACLVALVRSGYVRLLRSDAHGRAKELQVQDLFLRHPKPMWVYDLEALAFLKVNDAAIACYGFSQNEFLAMKLTDIRLTDDASGTPRDDGLTDDQYRDAGHALHRKKCGDVAYVHVTEHGVAFANKTAVMAMCIDVTDEVLSKRALQRQEAQFRQLHDSLADVLWLASVDGNQILYVTAAFEDLYGRKIADLQQDPRLWISMVVEEDRAIAVASQDELYALGHSESEYRIRRPDGSVRWISDRKKSILDEQGLPWMVGGIAEDITASKELDAARETSRAELERLVVERTVELERANLELDAFTRTAAHDLKTPLIGIVSAIEILRDRYEVAPGEDGRRIAGVIAESASHMIRLIDALLMLSRVNHGPLEREDVDLIAIAQELVEDLRRQDPHRVVAFEAPDHLMVSCDGRLVRPLLANLIGNAWKFTGRRERGAIRLSSYEADGCTAIRITDNGAGFDTRKATRLFSAFQRFHPASQFKGTGIGLATCQRIVQRHGGQISLDSCPGEGTTVSFTLCPCHPEFLAASTAGPWN
ncbi:Phytochrome-like protein cph1 [Burkholderiaceae bacterium]|nr:Phytochrome-like protein cph1 [Burkholderiaceae bacterium]